MARYLVTGGLGVIGSRFVEIIAKLGNQVTVIDSAEEPRNEWVKGYLMTQPEVRPALTISEVRVENIDFQPILESHDFIFHAAAHTGIPHSEQDPTDDWESNVNASREILEAMRRTKSKTPVVMLSSVKPYRLSDLPTIPQESRTVWADPNTIGINEDRPLEPDEPYAASKMAQTALVMAYARSYNLPVTVLRCSNLYGDAPCHGPRHGWLTWFCICAALGWPIEIQGDGRQTRDMLFSDDVVKAGMLAFHHIDIVKGNVYNIGGGSFNTISVREAVLALREMCDELHVTTGPGRKNEDMLFVTDHTRFTKATNWEPEISVQQGMRRIMEWARRNERELQLVYQDYINF